ncbi:Gfo/Idh/MocA family protein [Paenibacillus pini]|uniref:Oxidoreductase domain protein n=1 Tax=Paenibacillus pini JCM 16418 TaxID=1236976 RepID=W7Y8I5_9BACL|nr:Gfo/Idh/MocA family oxidoreductase [Paenibacillus pini]GAF07225.1 oxidoreductase domain protein [Paenibacillus pini JCM 16418]
MNDNIRKLRVAMIGMGDIARKVYLPLLAQHKYAEVVGIMSRSQATVDEVVQTYRFPQGTTDLETLLSWNVDAVFVHSPTETHYDTVMKCLQSGLNVYVDKPLSGNLNESKEMAAYAASKGLLLAVGFNRRFAPMYMQAKQWMEDAGGFDQCSAVKHRTRLQASSSNDTIMDDLIHVLDLLLWLSSGDYQLLEHQLTENEQGQMLHTSGILGLSDNRMGSYSMIRRAGSDLERVELHGNGHSAEITNLEHAIFHAKGQSAQTQTFGSWDTILKRRGFSGAVDHFLDCIGSPQQCSIRADLVLDSHILADELIRRGSANNG